MAVQMTERMDSACPYLTEVLTEHVMKPDYAYAAEFEATWSSSWTASNAPCRKTEGEQ